MPFTSPTVLMCPPPPLTGPAGDPAVAECELHQWGKHPCRFDSLLAAAQWDRIRTELERLGVDVRTLPSREGLPDLMFTADTALIDGDLAIISHFRRSVRVGEARVVAEWLTRSGFEVISVPEEYDFEGGGHAVSCGPVLFGGWFLHRELMALKWVAEVLERPIVPLRLVNDRYDRLDACFRPLSDSIALFVPEAFDAGGKALLEEHVETLIPVCPAEASRMATSAVAFGDTVLVPSECPRTTASIREAGFKTLSVDADAFTSLGGGLNSLILRLDVASPLSDHPHSSPVRKARSSIAAA